MPVRATIPSLVEQLERRIRERPEEGLLPHAQVEALDVVYHDLVFQHHPRGLELWREALWQRQFPAELKHAVVAMLEYLVAAVARGEPQAASRICNCLQVFVEALCGEGERPQAPR
jgi:hypothetical protein